MSNSNSAARGNSKSLLLLINWRSCSAFIVVILLAGVARESTRTINLFACNFVKEIPFASERILLDHDNKTLVNFAGYIRYKQVDEKGSALKTRYLPIKPFFVAHLDYLRADFDMLMIIFMCGSIKFKFSRKSMNGTLSSWDQEHEVTTMIHARRQSYKFAWNIELNDNNHYRCRGTLALPLVAQPYYDPLIDQYNEITLLIEELDLEFYGKSMELLREGKFSKPTVDCGLKRIVPHQHQYLPMPEPASLAQELLASPEKGIIGSLDELLYKQLSDELVASQEQIKLRGYEPVQADRVRLRLNEKTLDYVESARDSSTSMDLTTGCMSKLVHQLRYYDLEASIRDNH